jgi:hypothetical protein
MDETKSSRLQPIEERTIEPFVRSANLLDCSLYWIPVDSFPMNALQRRWLLDFLERLALHLKSKHKLREEVFLHFKSLYPNLVDHFTERAVDFVPMSGAAVTPGAELPKAVTLEDLKEKVEEAGRNETMLDVQQWMPDHLYWFVKKRALEQRQAFFGHGGILTMFLAPDPSAPVPTVTLPRFIRTAPGVEAGASEKMQRDIEMAHSLRDRFLAKSKETFGQRLKGTPNYKGLLFVLPFFRVAELMQSTEEQRRLWFDVFSGYVVESPPDKGVLLLLQTPDFDEELAEIVKSMQEDGHVYRA